MTFGPTNTIEREAQRAETVHLLQRMRALPADDPRRAELRDRVVAEHMNYARSIARSHHRRFESGREDVEQAAYLGLVKAVTAFDPDFGTEFVAYAAPTIAGEIKHHYRDSTWALRVPLRLRDLARQLSQARDELGQELGHEPTVRQLADHLGAEQDEVLQAIGASEATRTVSLDRPVGDAEHSRSLDEVVGAEDPGYESAIDQHVLRGLVAGLCERDKRILYMRFFRDMTQAEMGEELGLSQMQISRVITRILVELRTGFGLPESGMKRVRTVRRREAVS
jgi:RNA polymerase sigma-B factor